MNKISKLANFENEDESLLSYQRYTRKIVSCKVSSEQFDILTEISKERFGLDSNYELLQLLIAVIFKYDAIERGTFVSTKDEILRFLTPFLEIDDKKKFIDSFKKSFGQPNSSNTINGDIKKIIIIRDGGYVESFRYDGDKAKTCQSQDAAALEVLTAGKRTFEKKIRWVMSAFRLSSFSELVRELINDAQKDAEQQIRNSSHDLAMNEYGEAPVRTRNPDGFISNINPYLRQSTGMRHKTTLSESE